MRGDETGQQVYVDLARLDYLGKQEALLIVCEVGSRVHLRSSVVVVKDRGGFPQGVRGITISFV